MRFVVPNLLRYLDDPIAAEKGMGDATALVQLFGEDLGAALLVQCLRDTWGPAEVLSRSCTTGSKKGPRLDGWIRVTRQGKPMLLQLEIKSWSAHAIGGRNLPINASAEQVHRHKVDRWKSEWDGRTFKKDQARKVLHPMRPPMELPVEPAICYWDAMHPSGLDDPLFCVPLSDQAFECVWVFSASAYLRNTAAKEIELPLPNAERRIDLLRSICPTVLQVVDA